VVLEDVWHKLSFGSPSRLFFSSKKSHLTAFELPPPQGSDPAHLLARAQFGIPALPARGPPGQPTGGQGLRLPGGQVVRPQRTGWPANGLVGSPPAWPPGLRPGGLPAWTGTRPAGCSPRLARGHPPAAHGRRAGREAAPGARGRGVRAMKRMARSPSLQESVRRGSRAGPPVARRHAPAPQGEDIAHNVLILAGGTQARTGRSSGFDGRRMAYGFARRTSLSLLR